jgi:phosphoribosyl 1,2-cyclic phosphodiesterase
VRLTFLGVRGSTAAPGPDFVRYGGNTSCIAVGGTEGPADLVLDAGTGLRGLPRLLDGAPFRGAVLLSHLHWDHMQGLPFCLSVDRDDSQVQVVLPAQDGRTGVELIEQHMSPPAFPITPAGLRGDWTFTAVESGTRPVGAYQVTATDIAHKGGRTYGYRVERDGVSVAYLPDHAPAAGVSPHTLETLAGVDLLVHDAQFVESERSIAEAYGHATIGDAVDLALAVGARRLALFHHGPGRTDDALDAQLVGLDGAADRLGGLVVITPREGDVVTVTRP